MESIAAEDQSFIEFTLVSAASWWDWVANLPLYGQIAVVVAIFLAVALVYIVYNGVYTWLERKWPDFPIKRTAEKHWNDATRNLEDLADRCAEVYSGHFDEAGGAFDFAANLRLTGSTKGRLKEQPFCHVLAHKSDGYAVVVFRGTQGLRDWGTNLRFLFSAVDLPHKDDAGKTIRCRVHSGFARRLDAPVIGRENGAFESLRDIIAEMDGKMGRKLPIYLAGHSLGGALAVLAAARLVAVGRDEWSERIKGVITFGQPGMSDHAFREHYLLQDRTHRFCVGIDIVTFVPPFVRYRHVGHQYWLHRNSKRFNKTWMARIFSGFLVSLKQVSFQTWLDDHSIQKYIRELQPMLRQVGRQPEESDQALPGKPA